jgi:hypothetical protein
MSAGVSLGETIYRTVNFAVNGKSHNLVGQVTGQSNMSHDLLPLGETMIALARSGASIRDTDSVLVDHAGAESKTAVGHAQLGLRVAWARIRHKGHKGHRGKLTRDQETRSFCPEEQTTPNVIG